MNKILNTIIKLSKSKNELKIVSDQFGSPTYTKDIAPVLIQLAKDHVSEFTEVYHLLNRGQCS
jgi:dTDP-4-dehydrorhamnose reductase